MAFLLLLLLTLSAASSIDNSSVLSVTVYNSFAVVKDVRNISFDSGDSSVAFTDVATTINPETVMFTPKNNSDIGIL